MSDLVEERLDPKSAEERALRRIRSCAEGLASVVPDDRVWQFIKGAADLQSRPIEYRASQALSALEVYLITAICAAAGALTKWPSDPATDSFHGALLSELNAKKGKSDSSNGRDGPKLDFSTMAFGATVNIFTELVRICSRPTKAVSPDNAWVYQAELRPFIRALGNAELIGSSVAPESDESCRAATLFVRTIRASVDNLRYVQVIEPDRDKSAIVEMYQKILPTNDRRLNLPATSLRDFLKDVVAYRNMYAHAASARSFGLLSVRHDHRVIALLSATLLEATADVIVATSFPASWSVGKLTPGQSGRWIMSGRSAFVAHPLGQLADERTAYPNAETSFLLVRGSDSGLAAIAVSPVLDGFSAVSTVESRFCAIAEKVRELCATKIAAIWAPSRDATKDELPFITIPAKDFKNIEQQAGLVSALNDKWLRWTDQLPDGETKLPISIADAVLKVWKATVAASTPVQSSSDSPETENAGDTVFTVSTFLSLVNLGDPGIMANKPFWPSWLSDAEIGQRGPFDKVVADRVEAESGAVKSLLIQMADCVLSRGQELGRFVKVQGGAAESGEQAVWFRLPLTDSLKGTEVAAKNEKGKQKLALCVDADGTQPHLSNGWEPGRLALALAFATGLVKFDDGGVKSNVAENNGQGKVWAEACPKEFLDEMPEPESIAKLLNSLEKRSNAAAIVQILMQATELAAAEVSSESGSGANAPSWPVGRTRNLFCITSVYGEAKHRNGKPFVSPKMTKIRDASFIFETNFPDPEPFYLSLAAALKGQLKPRSVGPVPLMSQQEMRIDVAPQPGTIAAKVNGVWVSGPSVGDFLLDLLRFANDLGWLAREGALPFKVGSHRYLVSKTPKHSKGADFQAGETLKLGEEDGQLHVETHWSRAYSLVLAQKLCDANGASLTDMSSSYVGTATSGELSGAEADTASSWRANDSANSMDPAQVPD